jgi:predicted Zn-dependent protease with MMP-like domain
MEIDDLTFERLVREGIAAIPEKFLERIENVAIVIEEYPSPEQLRNSRTGKGYILFGLYEGVPKTKRWGYGQVLPDKITIFKNPILSVSSSEEQLREIVRDTVWHEIGHYFGMDEVQVREAEKRRRGKK